MTAHASDQQSATTPATTPLSTAVMQQAVLAVLRHPTLWPTALRQLWWLRSPGWWRRRPFLPLPDANYLHFRLVTAYGGDGGSPKADDLITYLQWCRRFPKGTD